MAREEAQDRQSLATTPPLKGGPLEPSWGTTFSRCHALPGKVFKTKPVSAFSMTFKDSFGT